MNADDIRYKEKEHIYENSPYKKKENRTTLPNLTKIGNIHLSSRGEALKNTKNNFFKIGIDQDESSSAFQSKDHNILSLTSSHKRMTITGNSTINKFNMSPIVLKGDFTPLIKSKDNFKGFAPFSISEDKFKFNIKSASKSKPGNNGGIPKTNQDSYLCKISGMKKDGFNLFAVMDGHGSHGHFISNSVKILFQDLILKTTNYDLSPSLASILRKIQEKDYALLKNCFQYCETSLAKSKYEVNFSGTTAVMVIQVDDTLICANTGDSRAILCGLDGIKELSIDHKPDSEGEKQRILSSGGRVEKYNENGNFVGPFRVWLKHEDYPGLAMSRSLGDFIAKSAGCSGIPEIIETKITDSSQFLIIASDGVWEFLSNSAVSQIVEPYYKRKDPDGACAKLVEESAKLWKLVS